MTYQEDHSGVALFMSLDIAGSTAFKAQAHGEGESPEWLEAFETFFREVPLIMMGQIAAAFAMVCGLAWSIRVSSSRDLLMSQFWQNLHARLQPAVPNDSTEVPGKK